MKKYAIAYLLRNPSEKNTLRIKKQKQEGSFFLQIVKNKKVKPDEKKINGTSVVATNEEKVIPGIKLKITAANADKKLF